MQEEERRLSQRNFYLKLSPFTGHNIASDEANFMIPADDILEAETRDVLALWLTLQQGKAGEIIANCAWWMTHYMDPDRKFDAATGVDHLDKLTSFAVAVLGMLADLDIIEFTEEVDIPDIILSTEGDYESHIDFFSKLEDIWKSDMEEDDD